MFPFKVFTRLIRKVAATATRNARDHVRDQTPKTASSAQTSKTENSALPSVRSQSMQETATAIPATDLAMDARDHATQFPTTVALTATTSSLMGPFKNACRRTRRVLVSCTTHILGFIISNRYLQMDTSKSLSDPTTRCLPENRYADSAIRVAQNALATASMRLSAPSVRSTDEASSVKTSVRTTNMPI